MKILIFLSILCLSLPLYSGEWFVVDSPPYSANFRSIDCFDSLNCVAVGIWQGMHTMARVTTDGGKTWTETLNDSVKIVKGQDTIFPTKPIEVVCNKPNLVIITATSGSFWRSTDRGFTWDKSIISERINPDYISMYDDKFGGVVLYNLLYLTTDGGISWNNQTVVLQDTNFTPNALECISVPDSNTIIINAWKSGDEGYTIYSTNRGLTWNNNQPPKLRIGYIKFLDRLTGWGVGRYKRAPSRYADAVFKTTDGGETWINQLDSLTNPSAYGLIKLKFWNYDVGVAYGPKGHLWKTTNGGELWFRDPDYQRQENQAELDDMAYLDSTSLLAVDTWLHRIFKYSEDSITSVAPVEIADDILLYPNPTSEYIEIEFSEGLEPSVISIYNALGMEVSQISSHSRESGNLDGFNEIPNQVGNDSHSFRIDVSGLPQGIYFLRAGSSGLFRTAKFVINR